MSPSPRLHILGVRHHSPACAKLVAHTIRRVRPAVVLIEGPADMNDRLDELSLPHRLPIAVFSFHRDDQGRTTCSWSPFCDYSPEWQALVAGREVGAEVRFMDLPAWDAAFHGVSNRYGDHQRRRARAVDLLCQRFHVDGYDALWDHLFEGPAQSDAEFAGLRERLEAYFLASRGEEPGDDRDGPREAYMERWVRAALARAPGPILAVCGGYHAPRFAGLAPADTGEWPAVPAAEAARSYLVPWSYHRLDAFTGYESGMPSPLFYEVVFTHGAQHAPERIIRLMVEHLRHKGQAVSAADLIAALTLAEGLGRVRGHTCLRRTDLLDGFASAVVKQALDTPHPWGDRGLVHRDTDALLVELLKALSGSRTGRLHERTPRPALLADVVAILARDRLSPGPAALTVTLALNLPTDLARSRVLHRLRVLGIPGFHRERGPTWTTDPVLEEVWILSRHDHFEAALIEAASYGATLEAAAGRRLEDQLLDEALDLERLATLLGEAAFVGIDTLTRRALDEIRRLAGQEADLGRLGQALSRLLGLWTQDVLFGAKGDPSLGQAIVEIHGRGMWLLEHVTGTSAGEARLVEAVRALREAIRVGGPLGLDATPSCAVFTRRAHAGDAPPDIRGACLGALWSLGQLGDEDSAKRAAVQAVKQAATPGAFGDFLLGLFVLAREKTVHGDEVLEAIDRVLATLDQADFLIGLPALRLAFSYFPPREKAAIAERIARRHGLSGGAGLLHLEVGAAVVARGLALEAEVAALGRRYALFPSEAAP